MTIDNTFLRHKINSVLNDATPEQLEALARIVAPDVPRYTLEKIGGPTATLEVPAAMVADVQRMIRAAYPDLGLAWTDGRTPLQRDVDSRLERMRQ